LDNLLPTFERRLTWAALNRELDGILPKKLELPSGASCSASCAGLICGVLSMFAVPLTLTRVMHNHVTLPPWLGLILWAVNWALCWVVIHILWASKAVEIPWDLRTVADVAVWWRGAVWRGKSSLPDGERELWHLLRKIIADVSGCEAKYITRETQLIDLGIE
jgi:hypothetical protein